MALLLAPLVGAFGLATETSSWFLTQRAMQHAADSAVIAAATNDSTTYASEAHAVATRYGYTSGVKNVTVTPTYPVACPAPSTATDCYMVTVTKIVPINMVRLVGYQGDVALGSGRGRTVTATAVARPGGSGSYCLTSLGTAANDGILFQGSKSIDLTGCDIASVTDASCNGQSGNTIGTAYVGTAINPSTKQCGGEVTGSPPSDIYAGLASNIPAVTSPCSQPTLPAQTLSVSQKWCGDVKLTGDVTVDSEITITIKDGGLDLDEFTLTTTGAGRLTIIFTGTGNTSHTISGGIELKSLMKVFRTFGAEEYLLCSAKLEMKTQFL